MERILAGLLFATTPKDGVDHPIKLLDAIPPGSDDIGTSTIMGLCARIRERMDSFS